MFNPQFLSWFLTQQQKQIPMPQASVSPAAAAFAFQFGQLMNPMMPRFPPSTLNPSMLQQHANANDAVERKWTPKVNKESAQPLIDWFNAHLDNPYPTEEEMKEFKFVTGFTDTQLGDWFRNKRRNFKKTHRGEVPWQIPSTTIRKRRASSISNSQNDSNASTDSVPSSPPPPSLSNQSAAAATINALLAAHLSSPSSFQATSTTLADILASFSNPIASADEVNSSEDSNEDDELIDVITVATPPPPEKRIKLETTDDIV